MYLLFVSGVLLNSQLRYCSPMERTYIKCFSIYGFKKINELEKSHVVGRIIMLYHVDYTVLADVYDQQPKITSQGVSSVLHDLRVLLFSLTIQDLVSNQRRDFTEENRSFLFKNPSKKI